MIKVEWVRDEPPMERATHFRLIVAGKTHPFIASYEFSTGLLMRERPELGAMEASRLAQSNPRVEYQTFNIDAEFDREEFVEVWHKLLIERSPELAVKVIYSEFDPSSGARHVEWSRSSDKGEPLHAE